MAYHPFRHLGLKLLSIGIAVLLWLTVSGEQNVERSLRVPLELRNVPEHLELLDVPPATVDVRVRGTSSMLSELAGGDLVAVVDLASARPGRRLFPLTPDQVRAPGGVAVSQVSPAAIGLEFERSAERALPIVPSVEGEPARGYVAGEVTSFPSTVTVVGPESHVNRLAEAITEPVSIAGATRTVRESVAIGVVDSSVRLNNAQMTTVTVQIHAAPVEASIDGVPIRLSRLREGLSAQALPAVVRVKVQGPRDAVQAVRADAVNAFVDLTGLGRGRYTLPVRSEAPPDCAILGMEPSSVRVIIR
jgi:YbbR domain-containing protein